MDQSPVTHEADLIAGSDLKMRFGHSMDFARPGEAQFLSGDQRLGLRAGLAQTRAEQPDIQSAALLLTIAQDLSSFLLPSVLRAASAAKGEFSIDLLSREGLPAE